MARWGEGDPRWLVQSRTDGQNVNGWHWEEKDRREWTKARLTELFAELVLHEAGEGTADGEPTRLKVDRLKDLTGDASITTRKGNKRFAVFDFSISLAWEGAVAGAEAAVRGEMRVEEVHSIGDEDDYVWVVTVEGTGAAQDKLRSLAQSSATRAKVYSALGQALKELRDQA